MAQVGQVLVPTLFRAGAGVRHVPSLKRLPVSELPTTGPCRPISPCAVIVVLQLLSRVLHGPTKLG